MPQDRSNDLLKHGWGTVAIVFLMVVLAVVLFRNAWIGDDAYISFRTVDNFVNGYGLTWNIDERVQGFTHPLWVLLLSAVYIFTGELFVSSLVVSMLLTLAAALVLAVGVAGNRLSSIAALAVLILSKAFIDYSTSGLENPLSYFLAVVFFWGYLCWPDSRASILKLSLLASLAAMTRMDTVLIYAPPLLHVVWRYRRWSGCLYALLGFCPFWLWELFSLWYYGFPFPNTAYAKLGAGIAREDLIHQGLRYIWNGFKISPITVYIIAVAVFVGLVSRRSRILMPVLGILGYLAYVVWAGGCFMSGRFLALPFMVSVALLSRFQVKDLRSVPTAIIVAALILGLYWPRCPLWSGQAYGAGTETLDWDAAITDERALYSRDSGLISVDLSNELPSHHWAAGGRAVAEAGKRAVLRAGVGFFGFAAGPSVHIVDRHGLTDPLLARLPITNAKRWRVGHYNRLTPPGYLEGLQEGVNGISHPDLAVYYDRLRTVISGDLFSWERIKAIVKFNCGAHNYLLESYKKRPHKTVSYPGVVVIVKDGTKSNHKTCTPLDDAGIGIELRGTSYAGKLRLSVDANDDYATLFFRDGEYLGRQQIEATPPDRRGMRTEIVHVPPKVRRDGFDEIVIQPSSGDGLYSFGHLQLVCDEDSEEPSMVIPYDQVNNPKPAGSFWRCDECLLLSPAGLAVDFDRTSYAKRVVVSVDQNDIYTLKFLLNEIETGELSIDSSLVPRPGLRIDTIPVPVSTQQHGFDRIIVQPRAGDHCYSLGHLQVLEDSPL